MPELVFNEYFVMLSPYHIVVKLQSLCTYLKDYLTCHSSIQLKTKNVMIHRANWSKAKVLSSHRWYNMRKLIVGVVLYYSVRKFLEMKIRIE